MDLWIFTKKDSNEILRFDKIDIDDDLGTQYFFRDADYLPIWISTNLDEVNYVHNSVSIPPIESMFYNKPSTEYVNIKDYIITKLTL